MPKTDAIRRIEQAGEGMSERKIAGIEGTMRVERMRLIE